MFQPVGHRAQGLGLLQERQPQRRASASERAAESDRRSPTRARPNGLEVRREVRARLESDSKSTATEEVRLQVVDADSEVRRRPRPPAPPSAPPSPPFPRIRPAAVRRSPSGRTRHAPTLSPRARALGRRRRRRRGDRRGRRRRDLAALHRRAADLGPERRRGRRHPRPRRRHRARAPPTSRRAHVHRSQLPDGVRHGAQRRRAAGWSRCRCCEGAYVVRRNLAPRRRTGLDGVVPRGMRAMRVVVTDALAPAPGRRGRRARHLRPVEHRRARATAPTVVVAAGVDRARHRRRGGTRRRTRRRRGRHAARRPRPGRGARRRRRPTAWSRSRSFRPRTPRTRSIGALSVLHAIILGIVQGLSEFLPDLVERPPDPRPRAVRLERAHVERLAQQDVRRRAAPRHARRRARVLPARRLVVHRRRVALAAHAVDHDGRRTDRVAAARSPRSRARSSARCSRA